MTEINKKLRSSLLPAPMIIKNYVAGDENCNLFRGRSSGGGRKSIKQNMTSSFM